jgi:hypothetical protein
MKDRFSGFDLPAASEQEALFRGFVRYGSTNSLKILLSCLLIVCMIKDVIIHEQAQGKEMDGAVSRVVSGSLELPALFAPDKDVAKLCVRFLRWSCGD